MIDQKEIILMTKLALYEKKYGKQDSETNSYFKWDYIYIKNWYTRLAVFISAMIIVAWLIFKDVYIKEMMPMIDMDLRLYLSKYGAFIIIIIIIYTGFSTLVYNKRYKKSQKRLKKYQDMLDELGEYQAQRELSGGDFSDTD